MQKSSSHFWLFLLAFYAAWIFRATWFYSRVDLSIPDPLWRLVFSNALKFILWVLPAAAYVVCHDRQNPFITMKISTRINQRGVLIGVGISVVYLTSITLFEYLTSHQSLAALFHATPLTILGTLASISFSPITEELFFRGFILPKLNENISFWQANLIQAIFFVAIHWPNWIWAGGFHWSLVTTSVSILLLGLLLGWLTPRANSIWPAVCVHIANNFLTAFLG